VYIDEEEILPKQYQKTNYRDFFIHPSPLATFIPFFQAPKTIPEPRKEEVKGKCKGSGQTDPCYTHPFIF
jgi:hypothetical protein